MRTRRNPEPSLSPRRGARSALALVAFALVLGACGGDVPRGGGETEVDPPPDTSPGTTLEPRERRSDTVRVALHEYVIDVPTALSPGRTVFRVTNEGNESHNFLIRREEHQEGFPDALHPGETRTLEVDLQPGGYTVVCTVAGHDGRGMVENVTVAPAANPGDAPSPDRSS